MDPEFQCLVSSIVGGENGKSGHKFRFLGNIELYKRPVRPLKKLKVGFDSARLHKFIEFRHWYEAASKHLRPKLRVWLFGFFI